MGQRRRYDAARDRRERPARGVGRARQDTGCRGEAALLRALTGGAFREEGADVHALRPEPRASMQVTTARMSR